MQSSLRQSRFAISLLALACLVSAAHGEIWVDVAAPAAGASGSAEKPFPSIKDALKAAKPGDTITLHKGIYNEIVVLGISGTPEQPTILRAAAGERVILSGFAPISDWKAQANGIYSATVDAPISDLYVGYAPQSVSRWPNFEKPMRHLKTPDPAANTFKDSESFADEPLLKELAAAPKSAMAFVFVAKGNGYTTVPISAVDPASGTVTLAPATKGFPHVEGKSDRYQFANHPSLIGKAGEWAFEKIDEAHNKVYFKPADAADLKRTQYRKASGPVLYVGSKKSPVSNVRVEGFEVCGSANYGIQVEQGDNVTIARCIIHNNNATGLWSRNSTNITFKNNIAVANGNGMSMVSTRKGVIDGNEIALNMVDGIDIAGNVTGRPNGEPESTDITVRNNYIHHHILLSHPDNFQCYRGVNDLKLQDNVLLFGMQGVMTEEVKGGSINNCVVVGTDAVAVIFGHSNSDDWTVANSTVGLGGWGAFSLTGKNYTFKDNIVWNNPLATVKTLTSDYNLFYSTEQARPTKPASAGGQEQHSQRGDPKFKNAPHSQAVSQGTDDNRADHLVLRLGNKTAEMSQYQVGDIVEINGDGVQRKITAVGADSIDFAPALPIRPFRDTLVWNWKKAASTVPDFRANEGSLALTAGEGKKAVGAVMDIAAYQRGEFYGDGKRAIPQLPDDIKAALPNPNQIVIPLYGQ